MSLDGLRRDRRPTFTARNSIWGASRGLSRPLARLSGNETDNMQ